MSMCRLSIFLVLVAILCAEPRERHFSFEYQARVPSTVSGENIRLWVPIPHNDDYQRIGALQIQSSAPYHIASDGLGNQIVSVESSKAPSVTVRFDCVRKEHIQPASTSQLAGAGSHGTARRHDS